MPAPVESQYADRAHEEYAGRLGMWVFLGSEVLFFAALFALYAGYRSSYAEAFTRASRHSNLLIGSSNTYVLITSSLCVALAIAAIRRDDARRCLLWLTATLLLGALFLVLKGTEYLEHFREGIFPGAAYRFAEVPGAGGRLYFTLYFVMTGLHALHVIVGLALLAWIFVRVRRRHYTSEAHAGVEFVGLYWHFVDVVWIFLWPTFYLVH